MGNKIISIFSLFLCSIVIGCSSNRLSSEYISSIIKRGIVFSVQPVNKNYIPAGSGLNISDSLNTQIGTRFQNINFCYLHKPGYITVFASTVLRDSNTHIQVFDSLAKGYYKIVNENPSLFIYTLTIRANGLDNIESGLP